ncbi:winged helix-turn-helix transcriptional regulator [Salmonella enterica subsp. enterica]|uniref:MarR family winged helix-turn-helix transcriptional regulator n=1 Tax=Serratia marcescens TaxID=615 RepID=UPI000B60D6E7|nr:MarR family winged helix-turn-helix transcriptional regulator [Serratia marcescens]EBQ2012847.1 winged helix-turn-helix transcriptional regulator [Salmonella enterica subsp. enterica]ASL95995.1 hypothetical protein BVG94_25350 [Serratia marcescens]ECJ6738229.1 winged helix-turn-helix transcriptional regulator [Salmonella enterica subsp. enterica]HEJ6931400.1 winged helix-turn-helix transcriptional regulator [Serratia marcescens]HEJ7076177.1 winged helix-turn-helix transcriptional regulator 
MKKSDNTVGTENSPENEASFDNHDRLYEICLNRSLVLAARKIRTLYEERIKPLKINSSQLSLLFEVKLSRRLDAQHRYPTLSEVACSLDVIVSAVSHACKPLIRDSLIEIIADSQDRRIKRIGLTAHGENVLQSALALLSELNGEIRTVIGDDEFENFMNMTVKICSGELSEKIFTAGYANKQKEDRS